MILYQKSDLLSSLAQTTEKLQFQVSRLQLRIAMLRHPTPSPQPVELDAAALEAATQLDRLYFEHHPHRLAYVRFELPGETPRGAIPLGERMCVFVVQMKPGVRLRHFRAALVYHAKHVNRMTDAEIAQVLQ